MVFTNDKPLKLLNNYLIKHQSGFDLNQPADNRVGLIIVIPAYLEKELIFRTLSSVIECEPPSFKVEVIVVLNASETDSEPVIKEQKHCAIEIKHFAQSNPLPSWLRLLTIEAYNLRKKHFGAGLARKIGLDEAVRRFCQIKKPHGIIACLDADSPVAGNYMKAIEEWFENPSRSGAVIRFEHPLDGDEYPYEVYEAITLYELHLRYYLEALRQTGFPYAFHTIGSCMVFRALSYVQAGGMPKKQAGEDFYFLQKLIPIGGFGEITNTTVFPSPRPSGRVIFGTGASIKQHIEGIKKQGTTYSPMAFDDLKTFFSKAPELIYIPPGKFEEWTYKLTGPLRSFLLNSHFDKELAIIQQNSNSEKTFLNRFFGTFNAFKIVKYLNYSHEHFYARKDLFEAAAGILTRAGKDVSDILDEKELLLKYREKEIG
jgi:glycosyltransferase involved in cell wall biosynthesis